MRTFNSVEAQCLAAFNAANSTTLTLSQVEFKDVRPVDSITPRPVTDRNTAITMATKRGAPFTGETTLYYDRIQLASPFKNAPLLSTLSVKATTEKTIHELLPEINRRMGTDFDPSEIEDAELNIEKGFDVITLRASATCRQFVGSVKLKVTAVPDPTREIVVPYMGELWYKDHQAADANTTRPLTQKYPPGLKTYLCDYSVSAEFLRTVPASPDYNPIIDSVFGLKLAAALKAGDGISWSFTTSRLTNNLYRSWPIYNGPIADLNIDTWVDEPHYGAAVGAMRADEFDNVLILRTNGNDSDSFGYRSCLIVHYNNEVVK